MVLDVSQRRALVHVRNIASLSYNSYCLSSHRQVYSNQDKTMTKDANGNENCNNCTDCAHCKDCNNCTMDPPSLRYRDILTMYVAGERCDNSQNCNNCTDCTNCMDCNNCTIDPPSLHYGDVLTLYIPGEGCNNSSNCNNCSGCTDCMDCSNCEDCKDCTEYVIPLVSLFWPIYLTGTSAAQTAAV